MHRVRHALVIVTLLGLAGVSGAARALSVGGGGEAKGALTLVEPQRVAATAEDAFRATAQRLQKRFGDGDGPLQQQVDDALQAFSAALENKLDELRGDGVLTAQEVSDELGDLREQHRDRLRAALKAVAEGYEPPPAASDFQHGWPFIREVSHYTFVVRNDWQDWARLVGYVIAGLAVGWLSSKAIRAGARRLRRRNLDWTAYLIESLTGPVYLAAASLGMYAGLQPIWLPGVAEGPLAIAVNSVVVVALFWFLWHAVRALAAALAWLFGAAELNQMDKHVVIVISRVLRVLVVAVFFLVLVQQVLDSDLTGVIAGLGVLGVALALILKGTIENIVASFTIFGDKPFRVGDMVIYDGTWGHIEDIGFRSTKFRTFDGYLLTIPNARLLSEVLSNAGARPSIRRRFRISLTYDTPPEKVREAVDIVREILRDHDGQPPESPPHVVFESYGAYDLRLLVQYHYQPPDYWEALEFDTEINLQILERFNQAGIDFAFPTQTTVLSSDSDQPPRLQVVGNDGAPQPG